MWQPFLPSLVSSAHSAECHNVKAGSDGLFNEFVINTTYELSAYVDLWPEDGAAPTFQGSDALGSIEYILLDHELITSLLGNENVTEGLYLKKNN